MQEEGEWLHQHSPGEMKASGHGQDWATEYARRNMHVALDVMWVVLCSGRGMAGSGEYWRKEALVT